jgi:ATP-dependent Clp protease ATP-binding subunit ClpB
MLTSIHWFPISFFPCFEQIKKTSPFEHLNDLNGLARTLTSDFNYCSLDQWMQWKNEIKSFISKHVEDLEGLNEFFQTITKYGMERNPQKTMAILVEIVSLDILTNVIRFKQKDFETPFDNIFDLAAENVAHCLKPADTSFKGQVYSEWKKCRPMIIYFIPNLINIFLDAFNSLDSNKKFTALWDKYLLLGILYKFFIIPYCLLQVLQPILVVTAKVYLVAAIIIVMTGILISCYQRWLRPLPDEIVNCTNLDKQMEKGLLDPKVGQTEEMNRLIAALEAHDSIILKARSGEGKTALIHHFIQLKHEGKLPKKLQEWTVYEVDCGLMISSISFGHSELINQTKDQIEGYENKILLFFDDFYQIATNQAAFLAFKKRFLEDKPRCKCILAVTTEEWEKLKELDIDYSFRRRICRRKIDSPSDDQLQKIMKNFQLHFAQDVPITEDAIDALIEISAKEDYLPKVGRAAKAEEIFKTAIGLCRAAYQNHYDSVKLEKDELKMNRKFIKKLKIILAHQQKIESDYSRLTYLFSNAIVKTPHDLENWDINMDCLEEIDILDDQDNLKEEDPIQSSTKQSFSEKDQILYLWYCFYVKKAIKEILECEIQKVNAKIPIQVNKDLIYRVYEEIKEWEESDETEDKLNENEANQG